MSAKPVHERISHRIMVYVGTAGRLVNQFFIEDIIKEELKPMESQLREADVTATAMGLAYSEMKQENKLLIESAHAKSEECNGWAAQVIALSNENARLREALQEMITVCEHADFSNEGGMPGEGDAIAAKYIERARAALANHFRDAAKMVSVGKEGA